MVEKIINLIKDVEEAKGKIALFILLKNLPEEDYWTVVISASWLDSMNYVDALGYWTGVLKSNLGEDDLGTINRISFLKTNDSFVSQFISTFNITGGANFFKELAIGGIRIDEAIVFESKRAGLSGITRENTQINYNPSFDRTINPSHNRSINPNYNSSINPRYNSSINPVYNSRVNIVYNSSINPTYNSRLNPKYNYSINPNYNPSFRGLFHYDLNLNKIGYIVPANNEVILFFKNNGELGSYGVRNNVNGFAIFNKQNHWIGNIFSDGVSGYNFFDRNNNWIGVIK